MGGGDRGLKKEANASILKKEANASIQAMALLATKPKPAAAGAGKMRKKLVKARLSQELVEEIMRRPVTPFPVIPDEVAEFSEECRATFAMQKANTEKLMAVDADIIRQYKDNGYTKMEDEVTDNEEEKVEDEVTDNEKADREASKRGSIIYKKGGGRGGGHQQLMYPRSSA